MVKIGFFKTTRGLRQRGPLKINFHKIEIIPMNLEYDEAHHIAHIFGCPLGILPLKYLGVPLYYDKLRKEDIQPLVIIKRIAGWRVKLHSIRCRLVLIRTCLASIPIYLLSFIKFSKWAINMIKSQM
jgi:hypothetical protein